eukprot:11564329-Prorocentrum_lima.AAC.1
MEDEMDIDGHSVLWSKKQATCLISTRQIRRKSLRTRSNYRESECNKPRRVTPPALSIYIIVDCHV